MSVKPNCPDPRFCSAGGRHAVGRCWQAHGRNEVLDESEAGDFKVPVTDGCVWKYAARWYHQKLDGYMKLYGLSMFIMVCQCISSFSQLENQWIGGKIYRKPWFLHVFTMKFDGLSCTFSLKPIQLRKPWFFSLGNPPFFEHAAGSSRGRSPELRSE